MAKGRKRSKKPKKTKATASETVSTLDPAKSFSEVPHQQIASNLMQLPQELRDEIYGHVFFSTRFSYGERAFDRLDHRRVISANLGRALGLLRICQRVHTEIGPKWLTQVLFHFESPEAMLNKLAPLANALRSQIRHVRVGGKTLMISWGYDDVYYRLHQALKLLPCLQLDRLTVLGLAQPEVSYETLTKLIQYSNGWKELRYISHHSESFGYAYKALPLSGGSAESSYLRYPQPAAWQKVLDKRDKAGSKPSVTMYRGTTTAPGQMLRANARSSFSQQHSADLDDRAYGRAEDATLMKLGERGKEMMVIVKRGLGVKYAEEAAPSTLPEGDIREDSDARTWEEVKATSKAMCTFSDDDDDDDWYFDDLKSEKVVVDSYRHVDEYTWPPLHHLKDR